MAVTKYPKLTNEEIMAAIALSSSGKGVDTERIALQKLADLKMRGIAGHIGTRYDSPYSIKDYFNMLRSYSFADKAQYLLLNESGRNLLTGIIKVAHEREPLESQKLLDALDLKILDMIDEKGKRSITILSR